MKNVSKFNLRLSVISVGVIALFSISSAMADDEEIKALTQPKSTVQVEVIGVDQNSAKFGEYNGLYGHPSGAYPNGALNVRGGGAYTNNEQGDTTRWSVTGDNLGLTSRSANATISDQGSWNIGINYDQLQHNITDTYTTPYQGGMNGTSFTLPSSLTGANQLYKGTSTVTNPTGTQQMTAAQLGSFGNMAISSSRFNTTVSGGAIVDPSLNITFEYNHLLQSGAKLGAYGSAGSTSATNFPNVPAQSVAILPSPTNSTTDTVNLAANWRGENSHLTASYFGSFYQNNVNSVNWQTFLATSSTALGTAIETMSTAPSNAFNQLNLAGGYDFSNKTKLTGNASIGQNTQNQGFGGTYDKYMAPNVSQPSMNGLVNTTHADLKLTDQSIKDLTLAASAKFDQRDNLTQSNMYGGYSITGDLANVPNTPLSTKQTQLALSGDYRLTKDQKLGLLLANNSINRWCNQYGSPGSTQTGALLPQGGTNTNTTNNSFYNSPNCASATSSNENKADVSYKIKATENIDFKTNIGYAQRKTQWDQSVVTAWPYQTSAVFPLPVVGSSVTASNQPAVGTNGANQPGYMPFFEASRNQFIAKAGSNWRVSDDLSLSLGGKYTNDTYPDSKFGVQNGYSWSLNFDSTYAYSESGTIAAYVTQQNMQRSLSNYYSATSSSTNLVTAAGGWTNNLQTNATTFGLGAKQGGLVNGKVGVAADLTYSMASSRYNTGNYYAPTTCAAAGTCGMLPAIQNNLAILKLGSTYELDKNSKLGFMYWFQHLYSNDYYYNGYQYGATPSAVLPTNQTAPSYNVNVFAVNYTYTFD